MRAVVIGGTGFISGAIVQRLARSDDVMVFHRGERVVELPRGVERVVGDRKRIDEHASRLRDWKPHVVIDCVAFTDQDILGAQHVFRGIASRLVVLSSVDVYRAFDRFMRMGAELESIPITEDSPLSEAPFPRRRFTRDPNDVMWTYDKVPTERAALADPSLACTLLRLPAVYGPGDHRRHRVGNYLSLMDARKPTIDIDARMAQWRWSRAYVDDVADAVILAALDARASNHVYNIADSPALTEGDWARAIARAAGYEGTVREVAREALPRDVALDLDGNDFEQHLVLDTKRIRDELGWTPRVELAHGLTASIAWERALRR